MLGRANPQALYSAAHMFEALFSVGRFEGRGEVIRVREWQSRQLVRRRVDGRDRAARRGVHRIDVCAEKEVLPTRLVLQAHACIDAEGLEAAPADECLNFRIGGAEIAQASRAEDSFRV